MTRLTKDIKIAAKAIKEGKIVAFPTDTVYGLGTNAYNEKAVQKIFKIKKRNKKKPLIINISNIRMIRDIVIINSGINKLIKEFWPGQVTIIFRKRRNVLNNVSAHTNTIAVRIPDCKTTLAIIKKAKCPVVSTSANFEGQSEPLYSRDINKNLVKKIDIIFNRNDIKPTGRPSTIIDVSSLKPEILRCGDNKIDRKLKKYMIRFNKTVNI